MCDPITIAGLALTAGSVAANTIASNNDAAARGAVLSAETTRNQALEQEAQAANAHALSQYDDFTGQQAQRSTQLGDYFGTPDAGAANVATSGVMPASSSDIVNQDEAKQLGKAKDYTDKQAVSLGNLRSFGDLLADTSRVQARDASTVGQIGNFEAGNTNNVLPYQLDAASHSGDTPRLLGDVLGGAGNVVSMVGLSKNPTALASLFAGGSAAPAQVGRQVAGAALY